MMKRAVTLTLVVGLFIVATLACGTAAPTPMPDTRATVDAAIAATSTAQVNLQETIDAAVEATGAAVPTPIPAAEHVAATEMTEEELAAVIDQAVADATTATEQCSTATTEATADGTVTQEEVDTVEVYVTGAEEAIAYAEELIAAYYGLYGELATETIDLLLAIEEDLAVLAKEAAAISVALQEVDTALERGLALAEETLTQLETAAQTASAKAAEIQAQNQIWVQNLQAELENRVATVLAVQPDNVATDRAAAIQSAFDYLDAVREGLADERISQAELANIAQLGANASASLNAHGGPQLRLSGSINDITGQVARGQTVQAKASLGNLEAALGTRLPRPSRP